MSLRPPVQPPRDGSISVLPGFLDFHARHNPDHPFSVFPDAAPCTFKEFADATHRIAHILRPRREGPERQIIAIVVHCDTVLYQALVVGAVRAGLVPFPMAPRNSATAIARLLQSTDCHRVVHHAPLHSLTEAARALLPRDYELQTDELIPLTEAFPRWKEGQFDVPLMPYLSPEETDHDDDVVLYLHSSGSTGFPKPIPQRSQAVFQWATGPLITSNGHRGFHWGSPALPPFHTMGILLQLYSPLSCGLPCTLYTPRGHLDLPPPVPTAQNMLEACRKTNAEAVASIPSFIEEWAQNDEDVKYLASLAALLFGGGPLSKHNGDKLADAGVKFYASYGGTEFGPITRWLDVIEDSPHDPDVVKVGKTRKDWQWMAISRHVKPRWEPQGDGTFELVFLDCPTHKLSSYNLPNGEKGYATSDLFEQHPTNSSLWRIVGRSDDVVVLSNGEKIVPIGQEGRLTAHPVVMGAVMFGRGREQPGILVEPRPEHAIQPNDEEALARFRNIIWPTMEEANDVAPAWGRVYKEMIIVADPQRPLPRAAKGTVQRKLAIALYKDDIEKLYETVANSTDAQGIAPPSNWSTQEVQAWLSVHVAQLNHEISVSPDVDLFSQGFDSLSATFLRNRIIGALRSSEDKTAKAAALHISSNFIFQHPSIADLASAINSFVLSDLGAIRSVQDPIADIEAMISKYTSLLSSVKPQKQHRREHGAVVVVTGTTGALGAHLIAYLLSDPRVRKVYGLNRGSKVVERQRQAFKNALLPLAGLDDPKLVLLEGDITREDFGLMPGVLDEIRSTVTDIIHNAWRVDFNLSLSSFEPYVASSVRLATLAPTARFFFTSSIASVSGWSAEKGPVPEDPIHDHAVAVGLGYGASKHVVEEVLAVAREKGMTTTTLRIGQIAGSAASGSWNVNEWVPALVKSSISLGCFPHLQGEAAWVPMDAVGHGIVDIVLANKVPACVNVVHPRAVTAVQVMEEVRDTLGLDLPLVPLPQWVQHLENAAKNASIKDFEATPAIKLLDFFKRIAASEGVAGVQTFETKKLQAFSPTMAALPPLGKREVGAWIAYWRSKKFLQS